MACMDESVTCYDLVGAKRYSFYTNSPVLSISAVPITAVGGLTRHITDAGVVAACADKTLRVYRKGDLVSEGEDRCDV